MFKPKIQRCEYTQDEEAIVFYVREASGREILAYDADKAKSQTKTEQMRDLFKSYVVNEDGSPVAKEWTEELIDSRLSAMNGIAEIVADKAGLKTAAAPKKD